MVGGVGGRGGAVAGVGRFQDQRRPAAALLRRRVAVVDAALARQTPLAAGRHRRRRRRVFPVVFNVVCDVECRVGEKNRKKVSFPFPWLWNRSRFFLFVPSSWRRTVDGQVSSEEVQPPSSSLPNSVPRLCKRSRLRVGGAEAKSSSRTPKQSCDGDLRQQQRKKNTIENLIETSHSCCNEKKQSWPTRKHLSWLEISSLGDRRGISSSSFNFFVVCSQSSVDVFHHQVRSDRRVG